MSGSNSKRCFCRVSLIASEMLNVLLFLLGVVTVETNKKHLLCNTPKFDLYYEMCDDSFTPIARLEPCELSQRKTLNLSLILIPRKNIDRLHVTVEAWQGSLSFSNRTYVLCSGADDEYDFCGALKGETVTINVYDHRLRNLQLMKDRYTMKCRLFVGEAELLACFLLTANIKYTVNIMV